MNAAAYFLMIDMESEAGAIARGLRRRDPLPGNLASRAGTWSSVRRWHEFITWLDAVARNLTIDCLHKKRLVSLDGLMEDEEHAPAEPADTRPLAWEIVAQHEQAERISAALVGIPADYRETVVLRFQEGLALEEIATVTGAPVGTVKSRLYRGLNMLMSRLKGAQA